MRASVYNRGCSEASVSLFMIGGTAFNLAAAAAVSFQFHDDELEEKDRTAKVARRITMTRNRNMLNMMLAVLLYNADQSGVSNKIPIEFC